MYRKYSKPTFKVKNLRPHRFLASNSKTHDVPVIDNGSDFDAKACSFNTDEEDFEIE